MKAHSAFANAKCFGGEKMIEKISKRTKKAITSNLKKLISKYGYDETRLVIYQYFEHQRTKLKLEKEVIEREKELEKLRKQLK